MSSVFVWHVKVMLRLLFTDTTNTFTTSVFVYVYDVVWLLINAPTLFSGRIVNVCLYWTKGPSQQYETSDQQNEQKCSDPKWSETYVVHCSINSDNNYRSFKNMFGPKICCACFLASWCTILIHTRTLHVQLYQTACIHIIIMCTTIVCVLVYTYLCITFDSVPFLAYHIHYTCVRTYTCLDQMNSDWSYALGQLLQSSVPKTAQRKKDPCGPRRFKEKGSLWPA